MWHILYTSWLDITNRGSNNTVEHIKWPPLRNGTWPVADPGLELRGGGGGHGFVLLTQLAFFLL